MSLTRLDISGLRNLHDTSLRQLGQVNVFFGENGSGKTSLLEAIHLLGMARSFRTASIKPVITHGHEALTVFGELQCQPNAVKTTLGVRRNRAGELDARVAGQPISGRAALAEALPLQVIHADSFAVLTGAPAVRRQFIDWGVFHVEPRFFETWQRFQRAIKQRNNLLRRGKISPAELAPWDTELVVSGEAIDAARERYVDALQPVFNALARRLSIALPALELRYRRGWQQDLTLAEALVQGRPADMQQGFTHSGPQRADLRVLADDRPAAETLSRGQLKLLICALKLAQGHLLMRSSKRCVYLVDDLTAEFDQGHAAAVARVLNELQAQVFVTCIAEGDATAIWPDPDGRTAEKAGLAMFHVEHGAIRGE
ncbi:MAG: DNA replication/repair protein RecF [Pseudomonadota bacterium]